MLVELFPRVHRRYTSLAISQWARPRQRHDHALVRHRRPRHEAAGAREGSPTNPSRYGAGPVAHRRVRAGWLEEL